MSAEAYDAFVAYGRQLGVKSFMEFEQSYWPQLEPHLGKSVPISNPFPELEDPLEKLSAIRKQHLSRSLGLLAMDLKKWSNERQHKKMSQKEFLNNYVGEACEKPHCGRPIVEVLNAIGVEKPYEFQTACINAIVSVIRANWDDYHAKGISVFDQDKFERFFNKRFQRSLEEKKSQATADAPSTDTERPPAVVSSLASKPVARTLNLFEADVDELTPLEPVSHHNMKPKPAGDDDDDVDDPFERNLVTYADLFGIPEPLLAGNDMFRNRHTDQQLENAIPFESRFSDWTKRQKERAKDRYHRRHPHADSKEGKKAAKRARKEEKRRRASSPGGPPGTMPRDDMNPSAQGSVEHSPARFVSFEELAKSKEQKASPEPVSSKLSISRDFLVQFLEQNGAQLAGQQLTFLAPSDARLSRNSAQFSALQNSPVAQRNLVATHLFESCESIHGATLDPIYKKGDVVVVSKDLEVITRRGAVARLSSNVERHVDAKHNISVMIFEQDGLLSMKQ